MRYNHATPWSAYQKLVWIHMPGGRFTCFPVRPTSKGDRAGESIFFGLLMNNACNKYPSKEFIFEHFGYDVESGLFYPKKKLSHNSGKNGASGNLRKDGSISVCIAGKSYYAHHIAWIALHGTEPPKAILHFDGDKSNNRADNIFARPSLKSENDLLDHLILVRRCIHYDPVTGDFEWSSGFHIKKNGNTVGYIADHGYRVISIFGLCIYAHRLAFILATGCIPENHIDHINGNVLDNRFENLRDVTRTENMENIRGATKRSATGFLGVHYCEARAKYVAQITVKKKVQSLGGFNSPEEAYATYLSAKRTLHAGCTI